MKELFNNGWLFSKIHLESTDQKINLETLSATLKDTDFSPVEIPHDWLIYNTNDLYENSVGIYKKEFSVSKAGLVEIVVLGDKTIKSINIEEDGFESDNKEMIEELIISGLNELFEQIDAESEAINERITGRSGGFGF